jgi:hypothetical protein
MNAAPLPDLDTLDAAGLKALILFPAGTVTRARNGD